MNRFILMTFLIYLCGTVNAQNIFQKTFGGTNSDAANSCLQTSDGGYIMVGNTESFVQGVQDIYLVRADSLGNNLWTKTYNATGNDDNGSFVQQTSDGGFIIVGEAHWGVNDYDVLLIKTDANGDTLWTRTYGVPTYDERGYCVRQTSDGGYIVAGNAGVGLIYNVYLLKIDSSGNMQWNKSFGGTNDDKGSSVRQTFDGGYIVCGSTISFGAGSRDVYLIKTDLNGDTIWTKTYGGSMSDNGYDVIQIADSGFVFSGSSASGSSGDKFYLGKTDVNGNLFWTKSYTYGSLNKGSSLQETTDGSLIVAGTILLIPLYSGQAFLFKTDAAGSLLWAKHIGSNLGETASSVQQTTDGGFILAGSAGSFGTGMGDIYLIKTDSLGNSGCNSFNVFVLSSTEASIVSSVPTVVTTPLTITTYPPTEIGSGGIVTTQCESVGLVENNETNFGIYPNPSIGRFVVEFNHLILAGRIEILDMPGEIVYSENLSNDSRFEIDLNGISTGIYLIKLIEAGKINYRKIIIERFR